ncbi:MAG: hypothetical protein QNJ18_14565 [Xenococcaceae cyanobacterium MO_167.B52]|nr:hypothetical protein [Xenococcaceae cyanobacterium MO_167.B52]
MTLAEVLPAIRQLSPAEKLKLIRILAEDLDGAENIAPLEPFKTYDLPTPYDNFGAGAILMENHNKFDSYQIIKTEVKF